jgi:hypothetical protein
MPSSSTLQVTVPLCLVAAVALSIALSETLSMRVDAATCLLTAVTVEYKPGFLTEPERNKIIFEISAPDLSILSREFVAYRRLSNQSRDDVLAFFQVYHDYPCRVIAKKKRIVSMPSVRECSESASEPGKVYCHRKEIEGSVFDKCMIGIWIVVGTGALLALCGHKIQQSDYAQRKRAEDSEKAEADGSDSDSE